MRTLLESSINPRKLEPDFALVVQRPAPPGEDVSATPTMHVATRLDNDPFVSAAVVDTAARDTMVVSDADGK